jgi:hypothetical protein
MTDLYALLEALQTTATPISGFELASERGNLSPAEEDQLADMKRDAARLREQAQARWLAATPDEVAAYDGRVDALLRIEADEPILTSARTRAPATRSPERAFDAWAIWITMKRTR